MIRIVFLSFFIPGLVFAGHGDAMQTQMLRGYPDCETVLDEMILVARASNHGVAFQIDPLDGPERKSLTKILVDAQFGLSQITMRLFDFALKHFDEGARSDREQMHRFADRVRYAIERGNGILFLTPNVTVSLERIAHTLEETPKPVFILKLTGDLQEVSPRLLHALREALTRVHP